MAANREERFLMRQRGAGTRQIRDIGFDIALPGTSRSPLKPIRSGRPRRTPQPELAPQRSRRTPRSTPILPQPSSRRTPSTLHSKRAGTQSSAKLPGVEERDDDRSNSQPTQTDESGSITKKRRLGTTTSSPRVQSPTEFLATLTSRTQVEEVGEQATVTEAPSGQELFAKEGLPIEGKGSRITPLNSTLSTDRPKKKRKKRKSIVQAVRKRASFAPSGSPLRPDVTPLQIITTVSGSGTRETPKSADVVNEPMVLPEAEAPEKIKPKSKRKKRKSIVQLSKSRKKSGAAPPTGSTSPELQSSEITRDREVLIVEPQGQELQVVQSLESRLARVDEEEDHVEEGHHADELKQIEEDEVHASYDKAADLSMELQQTKRRGRPRRSSVVSGKSPPAKTGGPKGALPRARITRPSSAIAVEQPQQSRRVRLIVGAIPVTVHRLSQIQENDDDSDVLAGPAPFPKKGGVNAVDVLNQICREQISKTIDTLQEGADRERNDGSRAEWTRKRKAVERFGDELDDRLFQMTEALDNNYALKTRLRQANKGKVTAREELLRIRRERDNIALQMDEVRLKHERASRVAQSVEDLNNMLQDIELAVQRGRAQQESHSGGTAKVKGDVTGLEFSLRSIAQKVSSASGGGLLNRVKDFNSLLERAITKL